MYWTVFAQYLLFFYTDIVGLAPAAVATMLAITRLWDTANDPVMGLIADRTKSRHGRYRPWLLWSIVPLLVFGTLTFIVPNFSSTGKLVYVYVTYSLVGMAYTAVNLPYASLMGVMTSNIQERTVLSSFRYVGSFTGNIVVQFSLFGLVAWLGRGNDRLGYPLAITVYGLIAAGLLLFTFAATRERVQTVPSDRAATVKSDLTNLIRNRPWVILAIVVALTLIWISIRGSVTIYYFKYYIGRQELASLFLGLGTIGAVLGIVCTKWFIKAFGDKRRAFIAVNVIASVSALGLHFLQPDQVVAVIALQFAGSFLLGPLMPLMFAMFADTADYGEWRFGRRTTGLIFAAGTGALKLGWAVGGATSGWLLAYFGYAANVAQTPEALSGLKAMMGVIPAIAAVAAATAMWFYPIDRDIEKTMVEELTLRRSPPLT